MSITIQRKGYGQVEPNHLSARYNGQVYAQLPAQYVDQTDDSIKPIVQLENGQFLKYNYAQGRASVDGDGEWLLVYNEEKFYDERHQNHKDFVVKASDMYDGTIYPRLLRIEVGDLYTTNTFIGNNTGYDDKISSSITLKNGDKLKVGENGFLTPAGATVTGMLFQVVQEYDLADGQEAVKVQRIQ